MLTSYFILILRFAFHITRPIWKESRKIVSLLAMQSGGQLYDATNRVAQETTGVMSKANTPTEKLGCFNRALGTNNLNFKKKLIHNLARYSLLSNVPMMSDGSAHTHHPHTHPHAHTLTHTHTFIRPCHTNTKPHTHLQVFPWLVLLLEGFALTLSRCQTAAKYQVQTWIPLSDPRGLRSGEKKVRYKFNSWNILR